MRKRCVHPGAAAAAVAFLVMTFSYRPAASATVAVLSVPADFHLQAPGLSPWGSPGDAPVARRMIHPVVAELLAGVGGTLVSVPLTLLAGTYLGRDSPNLYVAALPPLILFLAVPALVVTFAEWGVARGMGVDARVQPTIYIAVGAQLIAFLGAFLVGVSTGNIQSAALFTLVELVLLPGTVTAAMNIQLVLRHEPVADNRPPTVLPSTTPVADRPTGSDTRGLSLFAKAF